MSSSVDQRVAPLIDKAEILLDALPFHVIESDGTGWRELGVDATADGFRWHDLGPAPPAAARVPVRPQGYRTEVRPDFAPFLEPFARAIRPGRMLWIDYGFERDDLYHPARAEGTLRTLAVLARERNQDMEVDFPGDLPPVYGNPDRLTQVLTNLLANALKFAPDGASILLSANNGCTQLIDAFEGTFKVEYGGVVNKGGLPLEASFSPDAKFVLAASEDKKVLVWDATSGKLVNQWTDFQGPVGGVQFCPTFMLASAFDDGNVVFMAPKVLEE